MSAKDPIRSDPLDAPLTWINYKQGLLRKISEQRVILRDAEMWRVFHCLFRACVALAYPNTWNTAPDLLWEAAPTQEEQIYFDAAGVQLPTDHCILQMDS